MRVRDIKIDVSDMAGSARRIDDWHKAEAPGASEIIECQNVSLVRQYDGIGIPAVDDFENLAKITELSARLREQGYTRSGYVELLPDGLAIFG
ncbi:hypothetical protein GCM10010837_26740 [Aminobacter niigataensis]